MVRTTPTWYLPLSVLTQGSLWQSKCLWMEPLFWLATANTETTFSMVHANLLKIWAFLLLATDKNKQAGCMVFPTTALTDLPPDVPTKMHQALVETLTLTPQHRSRHEYQIFCLTHAWPSVLFSVKENTPITCNEGTTVDSVHPFFGKYRRLCYESPLLER